jgi:hypothetical protein
LTQHHRQAHVSWATTRLLWTQRQWNAGLFTDEICFHGDFADGCARVWRERVERFHPENVIQHDRYVDGSVIIWNKIGHYGNTNLVKANGTPNSQPYCEGIVVHGVVSFLNQGQVTIFQQDNA